MVRFILLSLIMIASIFCKAQDSEFLKLWNQYVDECNTIVLDTIAEKGTVTYEISQKNGDIKLIPKDTTWNEVICHEYKENPYGDLTFYSGSLSTSYTISTLSGGIYTTSDPIKNDFTTNIERTKICSCKTRMPYMDNFWQWLKDNGYRK